MPEVESNDNMILANRLFSGRAMTGQLSDEKDLDWYMLTVDAPGVITVALDVPTDSALPYFGLEIYFKGEQQDRYAFGSDFTYRIAASAAGTYYLMINAPSFYSIYNSSGTYSLTATHAAGSVLVNEVESNNAMGVANTLLSGRAMTGQLSDVKDLDWYKLAVDAPGVITVALDVPISGRGDFTLQFYNPSGELQGSYITGSDLTRLFAASDAGMYYLLMKAPLTNYSDGNYILTATSTVITLQFASTSGSSNEGSSGTSLVTVQATLSAASPQPVTVPVTYSGTATPGTDYSSATTSITIAAGQTTGSASFSIIGDTTVESNETVILTMGTPTNATLGANKSYTHTIVNDDGLLTSTLKVPAGGVVQIGKQVPILQGYDPDWTKMTAGSLEQFNVNGLGNGDNIIRAVNVMTILDDPADGRQVDPVNLGFWIEQIEEGTIAKGDAIMHDILSGFVYGEAFRDLALKRMDTNGDGTNDISYTKAAVQTMYRNVLGRSWVDIVNDPGANWLAGEIEANRQTIVDVAERICLGAEAINSAVTIVGQQDLSFIAFGDGFGG